MGDTNQPVHISSMFSGFKFEARKTRRTRRGDLIDAFIEQLGPGYYEHTGKKLSPAFLSRFFAIRKMDCDQMYCFYQDCKRAKSFSKYFWWSTSSKANTPSDHSRII